MGSDNSKLNFRNTVLKLTTRTQPVDATDEAFWSQFWDEYPTSTQDIFVLIPAAEIRALRAESPNNLATLCYKSVERLAHIAENCYPTAKEQQSGEFLAFSSSVAALNCIRLLTRVMPYIFEDPDWRTFFWSSIPTDGQNIELESEPLGKTLLTALCDLLFCPDFTIQAVTKSSGLEEIHLIDSCEHIWQAGVGFAQTPTYSAKYDSNRTEILKLLLTCFSETMYLTQNEAHVTENKWVSHFTDCENRHALPLFASLLNVLCAYDPVGYGLPYNHLVFNDAREPLVETAAQILCIVLESDSTKPSTHRCSETESEANGHAEGNLFVNYMSRIHRDEDFSFILSGISRLLNNPLIQTYLPGSTKRVQLHQELLILFWRMCDVNRRFLYHVLKSADVLDILVPVLYHLNDARSDQSRLGLVHICVFILLLLSGERNFGVRLNKSYQSRIPMDISVFTGTHADLLIIVFHKVITTGHQRLQPLFDCLLTIIVNISPYLKTLSMVSATKLAHLTEAFSQTWYLYAAPQNHQLIFFLLEVFNNIIQYQFDGNSNLIYTLIRKRQLFYHLANLPTDPETIAKVTGHKITTASHSRRHNLSSSTTSSVPHSRKSEASQPFEQRDIASRLDPETELARSAKVEGGESARPSDEEEADTDGTSTSGQVHATLAVMPTVQSMTDKQVASDQYARLEADCSQPEFSPTDPPQSLDAAGSKTAHANGEIPSQSTSHSGFGAHTQFSAAPAALTFQTVHAADKARGQPAQRSRHGESPAPPAWNATPDWIHSWKAKLPLQTIMRVLQVLVPQVEKICIDKGLTDESEIIKFLQLGTLVGLLPVPHPILIRKYQPNAGTAIWFRNYMWGVIFLRNVDPPIWYDTNVRLFEIKRI